MPETTLLLFGLLSAYLLLGSTSAGYLFLRIGWPRSNELERNLRVGWSFILGMIYSLGVISSTLILTGLRAFGLGLNEWFLTATAAGFLIAFALVAARGYSAGGWITEQPEAKEKERKPARIEEKGPGEKERREKKIVSRRERRKIEKEGKGKGEREEKEKAVKPVPGIRERAAGLEERRKEKLLAKEVRKELWEEKPLKEEEEVVPGFREALEEEAPEEEEIDLGALVSEEEDLKAKEEKEKPKKKKKPIVGEEEEPEEEEEEITEEEELEELEKILGEGEE